MFVEFRETTIFDAVSILFLISHLSASRDDLEESLGEFCESLKFPWREMFESES